MILSQKQQFRLSSLVSQAFDAVRANGIQKNYSHSTDQPNLYVPALVSCFNVKYSLAVDSVRGVISRSGTAQEDFDLDQWSSESTDRFALFVFGKPFLVSRRKTFADDGFKYARDDAWSMNLRNYDVAVRALESLTAPRVGN